MHFYAIRADNAVTISRICLFHGDDGGWNVMLVCDGRTVLRPATVGLMNEDLVQITKALTPKDAIVRRPSHEIVPHMRVEEKR